MTEHTNEYELPVIEVVEEEFLPPVLQRVAPAPERDPRDEELVNAILKFDPIPW